MHLIKGVCVLNTSKPKFKLTKKKQAEWEFDWQAENRQRRSNGEHKITFDQYCEERLGKVKRKPVAFNTYKPTNPRITAMQELREKYPSLNTESGNTNLKETMTYSGERTLLGIAVLHKSCLQPVFSQKEAEEIARMRRG
jgi:hypothetical protein